MPFGGDDIPLEFNADIIFDTLLMKHYLFWSLKLPFVLVTSYLYKRCLTFKARSVDSEQISLQVSLC